VRTALKTLTLPVVSTNIGKLLFIKDTFGNSANCNINLSTIALDRFERSINSNLRLSTNFGCWTLTNTGTSNWIFLNTYTNSIPKYPLASSFLYSPAANQPLTFWFDAADATTITTSGIGVTQWRSKTGGLVLGEPSIGAVPSIITGVRNGLPVVRFTRFSSTALTSSNLPFVGTNSLTIMATFQPADDESGWIFCVNNRLSNIYKGNIVFGRDGPPTVYNRTIGPQALMTLQDTLQQDVYVPEPSGTNWRIMTFICNREIGRSTLYINSSNYTSTSLGPDITSCLDSNIYKYNITLGCQNEDPGIPGYTYSYFTGDLGELLVFTSALSDRDRFKAESYLANKWALTSDISATNPYKSVQPTFAN
jgi:hypothetical protein